MLRSSVTGSHKDLYTSLTFDPFIVILTPYIERWILDTAHITRCVKEPRILLESANSRDKKIYKYTAFV